MRNKANFDRKDSFLGKSVRLAPVVDVGRLTAYHENAEVGDSGGDDDDESSRWNFRLRFDVVRC